VNRKGSCLWFLGLWIITLSGYSQINTLDDLEAALAANPVDSVRISILCDLSLGYLTSQPQRARDYAEQALALSQEVKNVTGEVLALNRLAEYHWRQSNYARAVELATQSLQLAQKQNDSVAIARAYRLLGIIYTYGFKQYDLALTFHQNALSIHQQKKDYYNIASLYGNITWIYGNKGEKLEQAWQMAKRGAQLADSLQSNQLLSYNYNSLGLIALRQGRLDTALTYLNRSIYIGQTINDKAVVAYNKSIVGNILLQQKNFATALPVFHESEKESISLNLREVLKDSYKGLAEAYGASGNFSRAFEYHRKYTSLKDSLLNWEITQKALRMQFELDEQKQQAQLIELQEETAEARRERNFLILVFIIGAIALVVIIILILRNNQQRKIANLQLQQKNQELAQANTLKDKLFSIIGHDMRSPLQSLHALLGMTVRKEVSGEEFLQFAPQLHQHVIGVNETLENLLLWSRAQLHGWKLEPVTFSINSVLERVVSLFQVAANQKEISLTITVHKDLLAYADENQIELVFRNLVHNAIKFTPAGGQILIQAAQTNLGVETIVKDSGVGIPADQLNTIFTEAASSTRGTKGERGTGLGLSLCYDMLTRNGGKISVTSMVGSGSVFTVTLPIPVN
jgi:two-component system, sensor histidine kinase and response regulator